MRVGIIRGWESNWYAHKKNFSDMLLEDIKVRDFVKNKLFQAGVSGVDIERSANRIKVTIKTAKPGIVIGRGDAEVEVLRKELEKMTGKKININISEIKKPELDAQLVAEGIAAQLVKRCV